MVSLDEVIDIFEKGEFPPVASLAPIYLHTHDDIPGSL